MLLNAVLSTNLLMGHFVSFLYRRVRLLSLEGCSLLTTGGLESVILNWKELERLTVISCNNIKDSEITPDLATLFSVLKELKWRPDSKSLLSAGLAGTGVGNKGGRFFKGLKV
jgi:F-box/leucine-rich repeat protein 2/20